MRVQCTRLPLGRSSRPRKRWKINSCHFKSFDRLQIFIALPRSSIQSHSDLTHSWAIDHACITSSNHAQSLFPGNAGQNNAIIPCARKNEGSNGHKQCLLRSQISSTSSLRKNFLASRINCRSFRTFPGFSLSCPHIIYRDRMFLNFHRR